ncbi:hypothetical protein PP175_22355 [Aneurinibacillus sp. Ricciae_BoGa-3]|uniref:hypothetical protein n=1 Tax=Aneurinibacillus sp. Ricciae_BoGa-3 TaxID=3022697 RepID=UPI0023406FD6|nr:hypothetical protein [Aneurinibacillus sp. Ricciae_BoGa-3]WCK54028.1 hypothetical protein PP175_22355 [Aneurinibacillus sp. Ricciae_BoGa-3]
MATTATVEIGSRCIINNNGRFFLLAEIEAKAPGVEIDPIIIIRITAEQARRLLSGGLKLCPITNKRPRPTPGTKVEFKCIFIDNGRAFSIFDVENSTDNAVLLRIPLALARRLIAKGVRRCTVIRRPFLGS